MYLSVEGLKKTVQSDIIANLKANDPELTNEQLRDQVGHCTACLTGQYPVKLNF